MSDLGSAWDSMWSDAGDAGSGSGGFGCLIRFFLILFGIVAIAFLLQLLFNIPTFDFLMDIFKEIGWA